jgi:hypothetical protein
MNQCTLSRRFSAPPRSKATTHHDPSLMIAMHSRRSCLFRVLRRRAHSLLLVACGGRSRRHPMSVFHPAPTRSAHINVPANAAIQAGFRRTDRHAAVTPISFRIFGRAGRDPRPELRAA